MSKRKWHELEELTEIKEDICDFPYTVDYVKEHGISCDTSDREVVFLGFRSSASIPKSLYTTLFIFHGVASGLLI